MALPQEASVACSTKIAMELEAFKNMNDPWEELLPMHSDAYASKILNFVYD
jgi:hypothetical protein